MSIRHDHGVEVPDDEAFVFADFIGQFCSVCAPAAWEVAQVIEFAEEIFASREGWRWVSIDKSQLIKGMGTPTPCPCNHQPNHRIHYFLTRGECGS